MAPAVGGIAGVDPGRVGCRGGGVLAEFDARRAFDALSDAVVAADADAADPLRQPWRGAAPGLEARDAGGSDARRPDPAAAPDDGAGPARSWSGPCGPTASLREVELTLTGPEGDESDLLLATLRESRAYIEPENSATKLRAILETISVGVHPGRGAGGAADVSNPAADRIAGEPVTAASYAEFVAKFPLERLDGRMMEASERPLARTMQRGAPVRETLRFRRRDGREFILEVTTAPFPGPEGGAVTTFADVTERYRLEQDLADRAAQFRALIDHLPVGVAYFDKMAVCRAGNGPARRFLGRTRSEIAGSPADELFAQAPSLRDALRRCVGDQRLARRSSAWPGPTPRDPGSIRYLDWQFEPLSPDPARPRGALALIMDVTERTPRRGRAAAGDGGRRGGLAAQDAIPLGRQPRPSHAGQCPEPPGRAARP